MFTIVSCQALGQNNNQQLNHVLGGHHSPRTATAALVFRLSLNGVRRTAVAPHSMEYQG